MQRFHRFIFISFAALMLGGVLLFVFSRQHRPVSLLPNAPHRTCPDTTTAYRNSGLSLEERVTDLMQRMTLQEKIGQMALIEKNSLHDLSDITRFHLGGLLSGFGAKPEPNTPRAWLDMINTYQAKARETCFGIPLLYGIDAIHGHSNVFGATIFPHAIGLGATQDPELVKRIARATTAEMTATGILWNFAPSLDVATDLRWGRVYETFGSDPETVSALGEAYIRGIQDSPYPYLNAVSTLKHFVGSGAMQWGSSRNPDFKIDQGNAPLDEQTLRQIHLTPFVQGIKSGAQVVMVGLHSWQGQKLSAHRYLITEVLKQELGFSGFVVSDWYAVYEISPSEYHSLVTAVNAGVDMIMLPYDYTGFTSHMERAVFNGDISEERLNDAVRRILTVKFRVGLFDRPAPGLDKLSVIGSPAHRELAREAVRKSQVLLKNTLRTLPLSRSTRHILVAGSAAHNLGRQSGGWTIEWQGIDGNWIPGTTILDGIRQTVSSSTSIRYEEHANFSATEPMADVGIAVVGEKPYAEGWGDTPNPSLSTEDLETIRKLKTRSKKLAVIIVTGRPLDIAPYAHRWDGVVAAWLPGSEGQGVADVLFGRHPFTGVLPVPWEL